MIVYNKTKSEFISDVKDNSIEDVIKTAFQDKLARKVGQSEYNSWKNSLMYMSHIMDHALIPERAMVGIEYNIPRTGNRIDFLITGKDDQGKDNVVIVELKQWSDDNIRLTNRDGIVDARFGQFFRSETHPSYQAWSYCSLMTGFNKTVYDENIVMNPCAWLHNCLTGGVIRNEFYKEYLDKAPAFLKSEKDKLREFIARFIKLGDDSNILWRIENGEIKPSKALADSLVKMLKGNPEFVLIDAQKVVYEAAIAASVTASTQRKKVLIVHGGPGTGKSVIAINLLAELSKRGLNVQYCTKNSAPRDVYATKLTGTRTQTAIRQMFQGSGAYIGLDPNYFNTIIVDEAHRLNAKSGMFSHLGENQVKEIISAAKCSVFFIDEDQRVTLSDIGSNDEIRKWAEYYDADVEEYELASQFRCNGSDGYLAWLDDVLGIRETANKQLSTEDYPLTIVDDPNELYNLILNKNQFANKARIVAGYCWDWKGKNDPSIKDIQIPEKNFAMPWNFGSYGLSWIIQPDSVNEIGCIHTCQGLEVDYIGVIIGPDLIVRNGRVVTDPTKRSKNDKSIFGYKKRLKAAPQKTSEVLDGIIKNTYRTLLSRGQKGAFVFIVDEETRAYFKSRVELSTKSG